MIFGDEGRHVEEDDGVLVQVLFERGMAGDVEVGEKVPRVARVVVIGRKHFCCHRLAEAAAAADTTETLPCEKCLVDNFDEFRLVDVLTIANSSESLIADVDVDAHDARFWFPSAKLGIFFDSAKYCLHEKERAARICFTAMSRHVAIAVDNGFLNSES